jgi:hypothetical protein
VLNREGDTVVCHLCGRAFRSLAGHVWRTHGMSAVVYRERFGLCARTGLVGRATSDRLRNLAKTFLVPHHARAVVAARAIPFEQRSAALRRRSIRLQTRLDPQYQASLKERAQRVSAYWRRRLAAPEEKARFLRRHP